MEPLLFSANRSFARRAVSISAFLLIALTLGLANFGSVTVYFRQTGVGRVLGSSAAVYWTLLTIAAVGIVASLTVGASALRLLRSTMPALSIDENGLTDNCGLFSAGFIAWRDIQRVFVYHVLGRRMLGIQVPIGAMSSHWWLKILLRINGRLFGTPPVAIAETLLEVRLDRVLDGIRRFWEPSTAQK